MDSGKHFLKSKFLWLAILLVGQRFLPHSEEWTRTHSKDLLTLLGVLVAGLRLRTDKPIQLNLNFSLWGKS